MSAQATENTKQSKKNDEKTNQSSEKITCGIIMPIATMSTEYTSEHWEDVRLIIDKAIERAGFQPRIVSDSEDSTIIHKSIINNIYNDEIIVCDVSNKNANVMFELGMRLAFNRPVVIIKDDITGYSFDTSNIEHIGYRKDLRHNTIEKFINDLSRKIKATHEAPLKENYQPFLSHFGKFEVAKIENKSIESMEALESILNKISHIESKMSQLDSNNNVSVNKKFDIDSLIFEIDRNITNENIQKIMSIIKENYNDINTLDYHADKRKLLVEFNRALGPLAAAIRQGEIYDIIKSFKNSVF